MSPGGGTRLVFALRQAAIVSIALVVAGGVVERLRPDESSIRGFDTTPFWWAAMVWTVLLLVDALAFETPQLRRLDGPPLVPAIAIGVAVFTIGMFTFSDGGTARRVVYLAAIAAGAAAFWWAVIGLLWLLGRRPPTPVDDIGGDRGAE